MRDISLSTSENWLMSDLRKEENSIFQVFHYDIYFDIERIIEVWELVEKQCEDFWELINSKHLWSNRKSGERHRMTNTESKA